jgi:hypothetical protein
MLVIKGVSLMESSSERKELLYIILFLTCFSLIMEFIKNFI